MANDAVVSSDWADFLIEKQTVEQLLFGFENVTYTQLTGGIKQDFSVTRDPNQERMTKMSAGAREVFLGGQDIKIPLQLSDVPGAAAIAEKATFPESAPFSSNHAVLSLKSIVQPIALTIELKRKTRDRSTSALQSVEALIESAYRSMARVENDFLTGNGDAKLAANTGGDTTGLVVTVGTSANFDQLTPGRVVDVRKTADGTDPGQGLRRRIASVNRSAGTVTFDTNQVASDGGSGNITLTGITVGLYVDSSYGNAPQGFQQATATSGTFEGIDKAAVAQWQGVQVDGAAATLSNTDLDTAVYYLRGHGVPASDYGIGHPLTVNPYKNSLTSLVRIGMQETVVQSGFKGVVYQGADHEFPILKDLAWPRMNVGLFYNKALRVYGDGIGPAFIDDDGRQFRFYTRTTAMEAALFDEIQLGVRDCGKLASITNLAE